MADAVHTLVVALSEAGYRVTQPRLAVIEVIARARRSLTPHEILARAARLHAGVGLATVYRTLDMLQRIGYVQRVRINGKGYAMACDVPDLHYHLVCQKCHGVIELTSGRFEDDLKQRLRQTGFRMQSGAIEVIGLCPECQ
jgi:Fur family ferric uptake transcriptional regulator